MSRIDKYKEIEGILEETEGTLLYRGYQELGGEGERWNLLTGTKLFWVDEIFLSWMVMMAEELCEYCQDHWIV